MTDASDPLQRLARAIRRCVRCPLHLSRTHAVPGEGDGQARVMLIGEAPGRLEDLAGRPFVGRSGKCLDELLTGIGLPRERTFITGSVKCRPPNNRTPRAQELAICRQSWLIEQVRLIDPPLIVLLGQVAMVQVLGERGTLGTLHGQVRPWQGRLCLLTYHPASGMRFPAALANIRQDFAKLKGLLGQLG